MCPGAHAPKQKKPRQWEARALQLERPLLAATREKPIKQQRPSTAKNKYIKLYKKEWNNAICNSTEYECHTEWSQSDREGEIVYDIPCMRNLKRNDTNELTYKTETHRLRKLIYGYWGWGEEVVRKFGIVMYTLLYLKWIKDKDLLYSSLNSAWC